MDIDESLKIFIDQLRGGKVEKINLSLSPEFMEVDEIDLSFKSTIDALGEVYIAGDELVIHLTLSTVATIPCSICNKPVNHPIRLSNFYHSEPLSEIRSGIYNIGDLIRENILLETPKFAECQAGKCPERKLFGEYLGKKDSQKQDPENDGHQPFSDLKWN